MTVNRTRPQAINLPRNFRWAQINQAKSTDCNLLDIVDVCSLVNCGSYVAVSTVYGSSKFGKCALYFLSAAIPNVPVAL